MQKAGMRGKLIVFEGGEGSGKTTQVRRLYDWLTGNEAPALLKAGQVIRGVKLTREPGGTLLGKRIRHILLDEQLSEEVSIASKAELLLYAADRAQHVEKTIMPWLAQGYWVLCDRYTDSTMAYQGYGRQLDLSLIHQLNQIATNGLKSDLTLWLNVPPNIGLARMHQRGRADRIEQASSAFHQRVYDGFAALSLSNHDRQLNTYSSGPTENIDGTHAVEVIAAHIQQICQQRLAQWYHHLP